MKVATIVGTRPEIIRLSRVMAALDRYMDHVLDPHRAELRLRAQPDLLRRSGDPQAGPLPGRRRKTAAETIGLVIARADAVLA